MKWYPVLVLMLLQLLSCTSSSTSSSGLDPEVVPFEPRYLVVPAADIQGLELRKSIGSVEVESLLSKFEVASESFESLIEKEANKYDINRPVAYCRIISPKNSMPAVEPLYFSIVGFSEESRLIGGRKIKVFQLKLE